MQALLHQNHSALAHNEKVQEKSQKTLSTSKQNEIHPNTNSSQITAQVNTYYDDENFTDVSSTSITTFNQDDVYIQKSAKIINNEPKMVLLT